MRLLLLLRDWAVRCARDGIKVRQGRSKARLSQIPAFKLSQVLRDDAQVHLEGLQEIAIDVFTDKFLGFCASEDQIVLLQ